MKTISDIEPISKGPQVPSSRSDVKKLVEYPLLDCCLILWDKNILTVQSSANKDDVNSLYGRLAYIDIDYTSLSEKNKRIAEVLGGIIRTDRERRRLIRLEYLIEDKNLDVEIIREVFIKMALRFRKQKAIWIPSWTLEELIGYISNIYWGTISENKILKIIKREYIKDPIKNKYYKSVEHMIKAKE